MRFLSPRNAIYSVGLMGLGLIALTGCASTRKSAATAVPVTAPAVGPASDAAQPSVSLPSGLTVFTSGQGLYVAGQPQAGDWQALAMSGVRTVVNLRTAAEMKARDERSEVDAAGMRYVNLPIDGAAGITADNARMLSIILDDADGPVLVHCASANRAGALLAVIAAQRGMQAEPALKLGRASGMTSTEARARAVIGEINAAQCVAAASDADSAQCPPGT